MNPAKSFDYRALYDLSGRVALVVGGGSGIGQAGAEGIAAFGAHVIVADVVVDDAKGVSEGIRDRGGKSSAVHVDVRETTAVERMVGEIVNEHGRLDVLLATPAVNLRKRLLDYSDEEFDRVIELNLKGTFRVARASGRAMLQNRRGSIILMSSMRAVNVEPGQSIYASTKAGIVQMTRGLAHALAPKIRVNAIAPGPVLLPEGWTQEQADKLISTTPLRRLGAPEDVAHAVLYLLGADYVTGETIIVDGGRHVRS